MQDGVGRSGYRMLAIVFLGIGLLGLASSLYAFAEPTSSSFFNALGFVLAGVSMGALFVTTMFLLAGPRLARPAAPEPGPAGAPPLPAAPARDIQFDFADAADPQEEEPLPAAPAPVQFQERTPGRPRAPPADFVRAAQVVGLEGSPAARLPEPDQWAPPEQPRAPVIAPPKKRAGSGMTLGEKREMERQARLNERIMARDTTPHEVAIPIPVAKSSPPRAGVPTVVAKPAHGSQDGDWLPEGHSRGVCSQCKTVILAPGQRPINLRCPRCSKVTFLA